jgi:mitotic-spindle organizing protein 1
MDKEKTREAVNVLYEVSQLLDTGLDKYTLSLCVSLIESGVHPETLAVSID